MVKKCCSQGAHLAPVFWVRHWLYTKYTHCAALSTDCLVRLKSGDFRVLLAKRMTGAYWQPDGVSSHQSAEIHSAHFVVYISVNHHSTSSSVSQINFDIWLHSPTHTADLNKRYLLYIFEQACGRFFPNFLWTFSETHNWPKTILWLWHAPYYFIL